MIDPIRSAQLNVYKSHFRELMEEFCPDVEFFYGPFGGENWSTAGFWSSFHRAGVTDLLIERMEARVRELESGAGGKQS